MTLFYFYLFLKSVFQYNNLVLVTTNAAMYSFVQMTLELHRAAQTRANSVQNCTPHRPNLWCLRLLWPSAGGYAELCRRSAANQGLLMVYKNLFHSTRITTLSTSTLGFIMLDYDMLNVYFSVAWDSNPFCDSHTDNGTTSPARRASERDWNPKTLGSGELTLGVVRSIDSWPPQPPVIGRFTLCTVFHRQRSCIQRAPCTPFRQCTLHPSESVRADTGIEDKRNVFCPVLLTKE
jgi:hypothetical protein